ncbi:hypothetical protein MHU86_1600 [Fragilaria crotonensis]|nr:hypothetical protein MHU86_1600 [Fragilaria crotonensis]
MDERANFPSAGQGMDLIRYREILKALSRSGTSRQESASTWTPPMQHDREMAAAMEIVRSTGSELAFVAGVTQVGLDDDLLRMRSKRVINHGFSQINNPCKGLGVIHHGAVSVVTGLYIGGHVAARGESTLDCVKILQRSMTGVSSESQIRLDGNTFFWDRGYGGVNGEVNQWSVSVGAMLLGTTKRMRSFPFTYDQHPGPDRRLIAEKGASAHYWATKAIRNGSRVTHQYALASRNGLGGWFSCKRLMTDDEVIRLFEADHVEQLTDTQRSPEWFNQRQFRITGTTALALWKRYAHRARYTASVTSGGELSHNILSSCKILGLKCSNELIPNEAVADRIYSRHELVGLSVAHLKDICRAKSLLVTGSKTILIDRVLSWGGSDQSNGECPILELLLEKWFMSPFASSTSMREGTLNESNVLSRLPCFLIRKAISL